jgi:hypothetical protein
MISALRLQRDNERHAHARTREMANSRISLLEAQVARRDAEIATLLAGDKAALPESSYQRSSAAPERLKTPEPMDPQAMLKMLEWTAARNRQLEVDMHVLSRKVCYVACTSEKAVLI